MGLGRPRCGAGYRPIVSHTPYTMNGDVSVIVTIVRGVAVNPSKADGIAVPAIVQRSNDNATPAASTAMHAMPGGLGCNGLWRNDRNQADKVAEQRNHGS